MVWQQGYKLQGGKYIIEKDLGQGGFGITYKVWHENLQAYVVIKTLNDDLCDDPDYKKYEKKFKQEARILQRLSEQKHKNIVRVRDLFEEENIWYLVMDFVEGESLKDLVKHRKLSEAEAVNYIRQIGEALVVCHNENLFHRDAHPGNIMIQKDGTAILIDFGLAGEIIPSTLYNKNFKDFAHRYFGSFEQMIGLRGAILDVYTLAASLYYAITRQLPHPADERYQQVVGYKLPDPLIPPEEYNPDISDKVKLAINKGMKIEIQFRSKSISEWLDLLPEFHGIANNISNNIFEIEEERIQEEAKIYKTDEIIVKINKKEKIYKKNISWNRLSRNVLKYLITVFIDIIALLRKNLIFIREQFATHSQIISNIPWVILGLVAFSHAMIGFVFTPFHEIISITIVLVSVSCIFDSISSERIEITTKGVLSWLSGGFVYLILSPLLSPLNFWYYTFRLCCLFVILNFLALGTIDSASTEFINLENKRLVYLILLVTSLIGIGFGMMVASIFEFSLLSLINQTKNL